jgi:integrase
MAGNVARMVSRFQHCLGKQWNDAILPALRVFAEKTWKVRVVPINKPVRRIFDYWALGRKNKYVFYNQKTGERFVDLDAGLRLACEKAEIQGVTWHTLRHTFASRLLDRGVDIMTVKELLGHSTVTVTMRYTHSNLGSKALAVRKLEDAATILLQSAPECSSSNPDCSKLAANSQNTLELNTEEWVSG